MPSRAVAALILATLLLAIVPALAAAATYEVDSVGDEAAKTACENGTPGCTLRGAVLAADATTSVADTIVFGSSFDGQIADTIALGTELPPITSTLSIDGGSCTSILGLPKPCAGVNAPAGKAAIVIEAPNSSVRGLSLTGGFAAIVVLSSGFAAEGNWVGIKLDSSNAGGSQEGIGIGPGSDGAGIGGLDPTQRNLIANYPTGLRIAGAAETTVQGNWFGVGPGGSAAGAAAVAIGITDVPGFAAARTVIGGTATGPEPTTKACDGPCNVIAGAAIGIDLQSGTAASGPTTIRGNYIGLGPDGTTEIPNSERGIRVGQAGSTTIGGSGVADANFFAGGIEAIRHEAGVGLEVRENRFGFGPVENAPIQPPQVAIRTSGAPGSEPAQVRGNVIRVKAGGTGIDSIGRGAEIVANQILGGNTAIRAGGASGGEGNLIEGNATKDSSFNAMQIQNGPNLIVGNSIEEVDFSGIFLGGAAATGNRIGGDTALSENVFNGVTTGPIAIVAPAATRNEIARNRGALNFGSFIFLGNEGPNGGIAPPAIAAAQQSSASGTAAPGAVVRLFLAGAGPADLVGFLAEPVADAGGSWKATFAAVPVGAGVVATQTREGGTSALSDAATAAADPVPPPTPSCATDPALCPPATPTGSGAAPVSPPAATPPAVTPQPQPLKCRKGFKKKRVKGKSRCVKVKKAKGGKKRAADR